MRSSTDSLMNTSFCDELLASGVRDWSMRVKECVAFKSDAGMEVGLLADDGRNAGVLVKEGGVFVGDGNVY